MNLILCGMAGSGKTSVARILSEKMEWDYIDTDALIESREGKSCREIYQTFGENIFRQKEREAVATLKNKTSCVIATGGGTFLLSENALLLKSLGTIVYLNAPCEILMQRVSSKAAFIDAADPERSFHKIYKMRAPIFELWADLKVTIADETPEEIAEKLYCINTTDLLR